MLKSTNVTGIAYIVDEKTHKYVLNKIGKLDRYLPRHARKSASAEIRIRKITGKRIDKFEVEATIDVPDKIILAKQSSIHLLTAVDDIEAKLATQLRKYKQSSLAHIGRRRIMSEFKRGYAREL